ncbi:MAG: LD-carboxypeptidase [Lachnospiraceae bacterium]|nr:LD-carboxypeptidase [Lachnospiraceae bacterium]
MITTGSKIGIVCCSNGQKKEYSEKIRRMEEILRSIGLQPVFSDYIYAKEDVFSGTGKERALALMEFYRDDEIKAIFDISGGDIANGILPYLDYDVIAESGKTFWGYSDLTTVINAIYAKTGKASVLYQIRNVLYDHGAQQIEDFRNTVINRADDLFRIDYRFISSDSVNWCEDTDLGTVNGEYKEPVEKQVNGKCKEVQRHVADEKSKALQGIVVGGNIRCFLKLAGTEYMPDLTDKILLLEGYTGTAAKMETYLCQLEQLGAFRKVAGILLGTFTEMQEKNAVPSIETLIKKFAGNDFPIAVTNQIGHGTDAKGIWIGRELGQ